MSFLNEFAVAPSIRSGIVDKLKAEIREREEIVSALEGDRFEKFKAIYEKKQAEIAERMRAANEAIDAECGKILSKVAAPLGAKRPTHGDAIAKLRGKYKKTPIGRHTPEELREPMIAFVKKNPGCKAEQIREAIGAKPTQMPVLRVLTSHAVRTKGAKRATTYWPRGGK